MTVPGLAGGAAYRLMMAATMGQTECVQELLEAGASTELSDQDGETALQIAEGIPAHRRGHATIAKLLRQHAAKPSTPAVAPTPNLSGRRVRIFGLEPKR